MKLVSRLLLIAFYGAVSLLSTVPTAQAAGVCPIYGGEGRNIYGAILEYQAVERDSEYIDIYFRNGKRPDVGNVAQLQYADNPPRWLVGGVVVNPDWHFVYHIIYLNEAEQNVGTVWFGTLTGYSPDVFFYFIMPAGELDHPNCGYGSVKRAHVDAALGW